MQVLKKFIILLSIMMTASCAVQKDYSKFRAANLRSILIVPVVNRSVDVTAPEYFLSTISIPVAEQGYYVFPVNLVKRVLEDDGLSDADLVHSAPTSKLCDLFGADAVLYVSIERWDAQYMIVTTQVTVDLIYTIKDGKTGDTLWEDHQTMVYSPQSNQNSGSPMATLIVMAVQAAITKADPNYLPLAQQANAKAFTYPGHGIPPGPYATPIATPNTTPNTTPTQ